MALWEPQGCCCFDRKTGCLILGGFGVGVSLLHFIGLIHALTSVDIHQGIEQICTNVERDDIQDCPDIFYKIFVVVTVIATILYVLELIFNSMLIHGVRKEIPCLMVPKMVSSLIGLILLTLVGLAGTVYFALIGAGAMFLIAGVIGLFVFLGTYYLLVMRTHYLDLKRSHASIHTALIEEPQDEIQYKGKNFQ